MLLLAAAALAHLPHDPVDDVAVPWGTTGARPWFMVARPSVAALLLRSDDAGATWRMVGGEPTQDDLRGAAWLEDGTLVAWGEDRGWASVDDGATWTAFAVPARVADAAGADRLYLATGDGLWAGHPATGFDRLEPGRWARVEARDGAGWALDADGALRVLGAAGWGHRDGPGRPLAGLTPDARYAGDAEGGVWAWSEGGWTACAPLPEIDPEHPSVLRLDRDGGALIVAAASGGPWVSLDGCRSWTDRRAPLAPVYEGPAAARTEADGVTVLAAVDGRWIFGGWAGFGWSDDGGRSWQEAPVVPADYTRGVAFAPDDDLQVFLAGYGAAIVRTFDGGWTFDAPGGGLDATNAQAVGTPLRGDGPAELWGVVGHQPFLSGDRGRRWTAGAVVWTSGVSALVAEGGLDRLWAFPQEPVAPGEPPLAYSEDGGASFTTLPALEAWLDGGLGAGAGWVPDGTGGERFCVLGGGPTTLTCAAGADWERRYRGGDGLAAQGPWGWPPAAPVEVLLADDDGLQVSGDGGLTWSARAWPDGEGLARLAVADDGTLVLATRGAALWRSDDAGRSWVPLGLRLGAAVYALTPRPGFADAPDLLVGTHDGVFRVRDVTGEAPAPSRFAAWQRLDDQSSLLEWAEGAPLAEGLAGAGFGGVRRIGVGARVGGWLRGTALGVIGDSEGGATVQVWVDGAVRAVVGADPAPLGVLAAIEGLDDGWHRVELFGVEGDGVRLDALEMRGPDDPFGVRPGGDTGDTAAADDTGADTGRPAPGGRSSGVLRRGGGEAGCGCAAGGAGPVPGGPVPGGLAGALLLAGLAAARRRR